MSAAEVSAPTYVLEASVERLELFPGELRLSLQLVQALRLVPHRGELQVTVAAVCGRQRQKHTERGMDRQTGGEKKEGIQERKGETGGAGGRKEREEWGGQTLSAGMQVNIQRWGTGGVTHSTQSR